MTMFNKKAQKSNENFNIDSEENVNEVASPSEETEENAYTKYKNVDWNKVSKEKTFQVMAEIMLENKRLVQEINRLNSEIEYSYKNAKSTSEPPAKKFLEEIAQKIAPNIINEINAGKSFSSVEMQEYIINSVLTEKKRYLDKILALTENQKLQKELLSELQQQVYDVIEKRNQEQAKNEEIKPFTEEDFRKMTLDSSDINETNERKSNIILKAIPLEKARTVFNENDSLAVIKAIGLKGLSEFPEISKFVKETEGVSENRLETVVSNLEKEDIIEVVKITTFQRNSGLRLLKLKDEIGYKLFKETFKKDPVKSEMQIIRAENDNYEHGYCIKDTCEVLRKCYGYEDVSMNRKNNTITVSNLNTWIPDIIGINPVSKKKEYFEVEMGTHNEANFNFKLDKALLVTSELKIIAPNKLKADEILTKVKAWYNSKKNRPNILIKVFTYVEFKRKEECRMYPTVMQEKNILDEVVEKEKVKMYENSKPNNQNSAQKNNFAKSNNRPETKAVNNTTKQIVNNDNIGDEV